VTSDQLHVAFGHYTLPSHSSISPPLAAASFFLPLLSNPLPYIDCLDRRLVDHDETKPTNEPSTQPPPPGLILSTTVQTRAPAIASPHTSAPLAMSAQPPHPPYRPSPTRAATLGPNPFSKSRAASQPAGERSPAPPQFGGSGSHPDSGRGSPAGMFGVIGGSRTPKGVTGSRVLGGPPTRASSFSVADVQARVSRTWVPQPPG